MTEATAQETTAQAPPDSPAPAAAEQATFDADIKRLRADEARAEVARLRERVAELELGMAPEPAAAAIEPEPIAATEPGVTETDSKQPVDLEVFDPAHPLWGSYTCPKCGFEAQRLYPGYNDADAADRALSCPGCGESYVPSPKTKTQPKPTAAADR